MAVTWTRPSWCPSVGDGPAYRWDIDFLCNGEYWSPQSGLLGGPPDDIDLEQLLRDWFAERGGPAATWRLQVSPREEEAPPIASVELWFDERVRPVKSLRRDDGIPTPPPCWAPEDPAPALPKPTSPPAGPLADRQ
ncbi:hypothetical protein [Amycolatopsis eburnea]|uniref:Uncharacterized protein n=1 Tax=Amycolatopsis eburnea TaxID=2267691 RepID=A0A3R9FVZ3_9PSEU|nr:hypothetical protein [Amycolatopsis eburnea]RSD26421.1 hypothetical protein EIY87_00075 [Amycolatopsis eburnea]